MELCPQTSINTGFLNAVPTFVHNHFTFLFALEEGSINEFFSTKKTLEKEKDNALFSKVYIFSRTNYNLLPAKTWFAMTCLLFELFFQFITSPILHYLFLQNRINLIRFYFSFIWFQSWCTQIVPSKF
jgi:hypothetical protein